MKALNEAQRDAWRSGDLPPTLEVAPGIWAIAVPCEPFPVRFTYCYAIEGGNELLVVDPGFSSPASWSALVDGLAMTGHTVAEVTGIVVTHFHPDHIGMASVLAERSGAWVAAHENEIELIRSWKTSSFESLSERDSRWLVASGVPGTNVERLSLDVMSSGFMNAIEVPGRALVNGEEIRVGARRLVVLHTPGHTAGHICLVDTQSKVVFTGDHVLPGISPNVGIQTVDDLSDPVSDYLDGLAALARYDGCDALPAHEFAFQGLAGRATELARHHLERADEIESVLANEEMTAWELAGRITWSRTWSSFSPVNTRLALAETNAHLRRLERIGRVVERTFRWRLTEQAAAVHTHA
ncbi:MAG: MBL fold metallo-hydrolase [Rhodoglobus sp.]